MSIHVSIHVSIHLSTHTSIYVSIHVSIHVYIHEPIHVPINVSSHVSIRVFIHMSPAGILSRVVHISQGCRAVRHVLCVLHRVGAMVQNDIAGWDVAATAADEAIAVLTGGRLGRRWWPLYQQWTILSAAAVVAAAARGAG